jgi:hypothetical protein
MEAGYDHDPMLMKLEEYAIRKAPHSRTPTIPIDGGKLQRTFSNCFNSGLDRSGEAVPKLYTNVVVPSPRIQ